MVVTRLADRLRVEARDLLELLLLPGLAALLPWRVCYPLFKLLSRWELPYGEAARINCANAQARGWAGGDTAAWRRSWRLMSLVDQADFYLARTRSDHWMRRHMEVDGAWPEPGTAAILCTFHWGAGMWGLRHMSASGLGAHALVAPLRRESFSGGRIRYEYYRLRNRAVRDALGTEPLDASASLRPVLKALRRGEPVAAAMDVPPQMVSASQAVDFLGMRALFPRGLLRLAAEQAVPVYVYVNGLRFRDGRRFLRIHRVGVERDADALMGRVFGHLEALIREEPAAWHFWGMSEHFFGAADGGA